MEKAEARFLTRNTAPPTPPKPYVHQAFPTWRYHPTLPAKLVKTKEEVRSLGKEWSDLPYPEPEKIECPADLVPAFRRAWDLMNAENVELRATNAMLSKQNAELRDQNANVLDLNRELTSQVELLEYERDNPPAQAEPENTEDLFTAMREQAALTAQRPSNAEIAG